MAESDRRHRVTDRRHRVIEPVDHSAAGVIPPTDGEPIASQ
jgi:hypothetical protein